MLALFVAYRYKITQAMTPIEMEIKMTNPTINIYRDNVWAAEGVLINNVISDCAANLGEDAYEAIEDAIEDGETQIEIDGVTFSWSIN